MKYTWNLNGQEWDLLDMIKKYIPNDEILVDGTLGVLHSGQQRIEGLEPQAFKEIEEFLFKVMDFEPGMAGYNSGKIVTLDDVISGAESLSTVPDQAKPVANALLLALSKRNPNYDAFEDIAKKLFPELNPDESQETSLEPGADATTDVDPLGETGTTTTVEAPEGGA